MELLSHMLMMILMAGEKEITNSRKGGVGGCPNFDPRVAAQF